jgi:hypothetical protein
MNRISKIFIHINWDTCGFLNVAIGHRKQNEEKKKFITFGYIRCINFFQRKDSWVTLKI